MQAERANTAPVIGRGSESTPSVQPLVEQASVRSAHTGPFDDPNLGTPIRARSPAIEKPIIPRKRDKARPKIPGIVFTVLLGHELAPSVKQALENKAKPVVPK